MYSSKRRMRLFRHPAFSGIVTYDTLTLSRTDSSNTAFVTKYTTTGRVAWAARISIPSGSSVVTSVVTDSSGNIYATGEYSSSFSPRILTFFNTDGTPSNITLESVLNEPNVFLVKYSALGKIQWATRLGESGIEAVNKVIVDSSGNIVITGSFTSSPSLTIYNAPGTTSTIAPLDNNATQQVFIVKYDSNGTAIWATRMSGGTSNSGISIVSDKSNNIYVTGTYSSSTLTIYNVGGGTTLSLSKLGTTESFIVKYDSNGIGVWATRIYSGGGVTFIFDISIDSADNLCCVGSYSFQATLSDVGGGVTLPVLFNSGSLNTFIVKYNSNGIGVWVARIGNDNTVEPAGITIDSSNNISVITTDRTTNTLTIYNSGGTNSTLSTLPSALRRIVVVKYNSSGIAQWRGYINSISGGEAFARSIGTDTSGDLYVVGQFSTDVRAFDKDNTSTFSAIQSAGSADVVLVKYNANGIPQWITSIQGSGFDFPRSVVVYNPDNVLVVGGRYSSTPLTLRSVGF